MICHQQVSLVMNPLERNPMAAFGDLIVIVVVGFVTWEDCALGRATTIANLQLLCGDCNRKKDADL